MKESIKDLFFLGSTQKKKNNQTICLMAFCLCIFSNQKHSLWLIRKEWPPHRATQAGSSARLRVLYPAECLLCLVQTPPQVLTANSSEGQMLNSSGNVFTGPLGSSHGGSRCCTQTKRNHAQRYLTSICSTVVIFKMAVNTDLVLPDLISAPFILNSGYLGVSSSKLISE